MPVENRFKLNELKRQRDALDMERLELEVAIKKMTNNWHTHGIDSPAGLRSNLNLRMSECGLRSQKLRVEIKALERDGVEARRQTDEYHKVRLYEILKKLLESADLGEYITQAKESFINERTQQKAEYENY